MNQWFFHTEGSQNHPQVVLLHGWLGAAEHWKEQLTEWSTNYQWIIPELPGHSKKAIKKSGEWSFSDISTSLRLALGNQFGEQSKTFIGYSMGGRLALYLACHAPDSVHALVLESCQPGIQNQAERKKRAKKDDERAEEILSKGLPAFVSNWYQAPLFQSLQRDPLLYQQTIKRRLSHEPTAVAKILKDLSPGRQPHVWEQLTHLPMNVLLLCGELDQKYMGIMANMDSLIPSSELSIIPNVGHNTHLEAPLDWQREIEKFLQQMYPKCDILDKKHVRLHKQK